MKPNSEREKLKTLRDGRAIDHAVQATNEKSRGEKIIMRAVEPLYQTFIFMMGRRRKFYQDISSQCLVGCFVESWASIFEGKPVDSKSPLFREIIDAIDCFLNKQSYLRGDQFNSLERLILRPRHSQWAMRNAVNLDGQAAYKLVLKYRLAKIFRKYVNLHNYVGYLAAKEIEALEKNSNVIPSVSFWSDAVDFGKLPFQLNAQTSPRKAGSALRRNVRHLKRELAEGNYIKLDISISDITTFIGFSGTLLLVLGYIRIYIISAYFNLPFQDYFGTSDYLTTSINLTGQYLFGAILGAAFAFGNNSKSGAYSIHEAEVRSRSLPGRLEWFGLHSIGILGGVGLLGVYYIQRVVDPLFLFVGLLYPASLLIPRLAKSFFINPLKSYIFVWLIFSTIASVLSGVVREINQLDAQPVTSKVRSLKFQDREFSEAEWQFIAFTSEYVIMRNRKAGTLLVRPRSALKEIEGSPS